MGFIERLRQRIGAEKLANQQREDLSNATKQAEEAIREKQEQQERELHRKRRGQAMEFYGESGIGRLVQELKDLINQDPANKVIYYFEEDELRKLREPDAYSMDPDSRKETIYWWDGKENPSPRSPKNTFLRAHYINYFDATISPDGDIGFHAKSHKTVPVSTWRLDKGSLEEALEKSFTNPNQLIRERALQPPHVIEPYRTIGNG